MSSKEAAGSSRASSSVDAETQTDPYVLHLSPTKAMPVVAKTPSPKQSFSSRPVTRSSTGTIRTRTFAASDSEEDDEEEYYRPSKKKRKNGSENDGNYGHGVMTCVRVNRIPFIMDELKKSLPCPEDEYDLYSIETLILNCTMDTVNFEDEDDLMEFLKKCVAETDKFKITKKWKNPVPQPSYDETHDEQVIKAYNELMTSEEQEKLRSYRYDSQHCPKWTAEDWAKFEEAYKLFPDAPTANRKIADYMGNGVHANHVAAYKNIYKKRLKNKQKTEAKEE